MEEEEEEEDEEDEEEEEKEDQEEDEDEEDEEDEEEEEKEDQEEEEEGGEGGRESPGGFSVALPTGEVSGRDDVCVREDDVEEEDGGRGERRLTVVVRSSANFGHDNRRVSFSNSGERIFDPPSESVVSTSTTDMISH
jgi:hypothetical protein